MLIKAALCLSMFTVVRGEYARHNVKKRCKREKNTATATKEHLIIT